MNVFISVSNNYFVSYPAMPEELAVAAVTVLSFFLVGGC